MKVQSNVEASIMDENDYWDSLIQGLRTNQPEAVRRFCELYGPQVQALADRHLPAGLQRRVGTEDVAQSACRTFLRRIHLGQFELADSGDLWRLLCAITLTKVREQTRFHMAQKRGLQQEQALAADPEASGDFAFGAAARGPTPAEAAEFADQFQQLLATLDEEEQQVLEWKLQDCTNDQVAERMGCSERTARRILKRVQSKLARVFDVKA
jgi:RNA polymerase sigma factor (sigma-70 family)